VTPAEFWFPVGAVGLYLYDSAVLLWQNELVFLRTRRGWLVAGGLELRLRARRVYLPNPLLAHRPQFLVCWRKGNSDAMQPVGEDPQELLHALRPIAWLNVFQVLLLASLPFVLWSLGAGVLALGVIALYYLATIAGLVLAWRQRVRLRMTARKFWPLALDALACAPFAANMTRKLAMRHGLDGEPLRFAARHFGDAALLHTRELVEARVREEYGAPERVGLGEEVLVNLLPRLAR
jgi:hypothetical protein